jgi:hypothetical protein
VCEREAERERKRERGGERERERKREREKKRPRLLTWHFSEVNGDSSPYSNTLTTHQEHISNTLATH